MCSSDLKHTILKGNATSSCNILHIVFPWPQQIRRLFLSLLKVMRSFLPTLFSPAPYFFFFFLSIFILFLFLWPEQSNGVPVFWLRWIGCNFIKSWHEQSLHRFSWSVQHKSHSLTGHSFYACPNNTRNSQRELNSLPHDENIETKQALNQSVGVVSHLSFNLLDSEACPQSWKIIHSYGRTPPIGVNIFSSISYWYHNHANRSVKCYLDLA